MTAATAVLVSLALIGSAGKEESRSWYKERVVWNYGTEGLAWSRSITLGDQTYRLTLQPLWAVEGGIVAMEIVLSALDNPDTNLFGEREMDVSAPFVFTVEDLASGISKTPFGARRALPIPAPGKGALRVHIVSHVLGKGVGMCRDCDNIQSVTLDFTASPK